MKEIELSLVIPCYNEEQTINIFYNETCKILQSINLEEVSEFIFVNDGSSDKTLEILRNLSKNDFRVHYISFSRNFGKESALYAGLTKASGNFTAILDADMQDPPSLLPKMYSCVKSGDFDCAATRRSTRKNEPIIRSFFARLFYKIMRTLSNVQIVDGARDYRLMNLNYKNSVLSLHERNRFTKGIFPWVGYETKYFEYENIERSAGETKWSFWKLFLYSIDGIIGFSTKPLALSILLGFFGIFISFSMIIFIIIRKLMFGDPVQGWASLVRIILFTSSVQSLLLGIVGLYISKIYLEVKERPIYIIKEEN